MYNVISRTVSIYFCVRLQYRVVDFFIQQCNDGCTVCELSVFSVLGILACVLQVGAVW